MPQQAKQGAVQINKPTCNVDLLGVGGDGCGRDRAVGEVAPRAIVDVLHLGLQLAQPQHDVVQQHSQGLLQVCKSESTSRVLYPSSKSFSAHFPLKLACQSLIAKQSTAAYAWKICLDNWNLAGWNA